MTPPEPRAADGPVLVLAALKDELGGLRRGLEGARWTGAGRERRLEGRLGEARAAAFKTGVGPLNARRAAEAALDAFPEARGVLNVGYCGGLDPALPRGAVVLSRECLALEGGAAGEAEAVPCDAALLDRAVELLGREGFPCFVGRTLSVVEALGATREKVAAGRRHKALAVDMESAQVGAVCRERKVPFLACRVVIDSARRQLPDFSRFTDDDYRIRPHLLALEVLRSPRTLALFARAAVDSRRVKPVVDRTALLLVRGLG